MKIAGMNPSIFYGVKKTHAEVVKPRLGRLTTRSIFTAAAEEKCRAWPGIFSSSWLLGCRAAS
jgi:hypothetical protein